MGGKRKLCPTIFRELDRIIPRRQWRTLHLLDAFLGGGSVSLYAKAQGFRVTCCDLAIRSQLVGLGLIENGRVKLTRHDLAAILAARAEGPGPITEKFSPAVFHANSALMLDAIMRVADRIEDPARSSLLRLLVVKLSMRIHAMSFVRPGTAHRLTTGELENISASCLRNYVHQFAITPEDVEKEIDFLNGGVFPGRARFIFGDIMEALPNADADVAYFDPPYPGATKYEMYYATIDAMLEGERREDSAFSAKDGADLLDGMLAKAVHIPVWIMSLNNAVVPISEIEEKMAAAGRAVHATEIKCLYSLGGWAREDGSTWEDGKRKAAEYLLLSWDRERVREITNRMMTLPVATGQPGDNRFPPSTNANGRELRLGTSTTQETDPLPAIQTPEEAVL